jgi:hypothetical protein
MCCDAFLISLLQTEIDFAQMEPVQRNPAEMERQDPTEQRDLAMLAHAV